MGYPVVDMDVTVFKVEYRDGVSSEPDFRVAAALAFQEACRKAEAYLGQPGGSGVGTEWRIFLSMGATCAGRITGQFAFR